MKSGFYIVGKMAGHFKSSFTNKDTGEIRTRNLLGVQLARLNKFGSYDNETIEIRVDDDNYNQALISTVEKSRGMEVMISVTPREWAMEDGKKGITYFLDRDSSIEIIEE